MVNQCRRRHNTKRKHGGSYNVSYIPSWVTAHISLSRYLDIAGNLTTLKASLRSGSQYVKDLFSGHPGIEPGAARIEMLARLITASGSDASLAMPFVLNDPVPLNEPVDAS